MADRAKNNENIKENKVSTTDESSPPIIPGFESKSELKEEFDSDDDDSFLLAVQNDFEIEPPKNFDSDEDSFLLAAAQDDFEIVPGPSTKQNDTRLHTDDENKLFRKSSGNVFDNDIFLADAVHDDFEIEPPKKFDSDEDSFLLAAAQDDLEIVPDHSSGNVFDDDIDGK